MRALSATLAAAACAPSRVPYVEVKAANRLYGAVRLKFTRLYTGAEDAGRHTAAMAAQSAVYSLCRLRAGAAPDQRLYYQRVVSPGPASDFATWTDTGITGVSGVASCAYGAAVSQFYIAAGMLYHRESADAGATWSAWAALATGCGAVINGMAAAYKDATTPACFWFNGETLYVTRRIAGAWETPRAKPGDLAGASGLAVIYAGDWNVVATAGGATPGVYISALGDNYGYLAGSWLGWTAVISTVTETQYSYAGPSLMVEG